MNSRWEKHKKNNIKKERRELRRWVEMIDYCDLKWPSPRETPSTIDRRKKAMDNYAILARIGKGIDESARRLYFLLEEDISERNIDKVLKENGGDIFGGILESVFFEK